MSVVDEIIREEINSFYDKYIFEYFFAEGIYKFLCYCYNIYTPKKFKCATKKPRANWWHFFSKDLEINDRNKETGQTL